MIRNMGKNSVESMREEINSLSKKLPEIKKTMGSTKITDPNTIECFIKSSIDNIDQILKKYDSKQGNNNYNYENDIKCIKDVIKEISTYQDDVLYNNMIDSLLKDVLNRHNITLGDILFNNYEKAWFSEYIKSILEEINRYNEIAPSR